MAGSLYAQDNTVFERFNLREDGRNLQSPTEFLGYRLGSQFTLYATAVSYVQYLADNSPRLQLRHYGKTYEGRDLYVLIATHEDLAGSLEVIRDRQQRLVQAAFTRLDAEATLVQQPTIVGLSYNIHGNEASGTEAVLQVAYELATTDDPQLLETLRQTVSLLFVCINPDGRDRYVYWYNSVARNTGGEDPADLEHYAPWPNGRTNHYWFDLNRDWIWGVHPESRGHTAVYQDWMPNVHVDYHEQGYHANYFTMPGTTPRNQLLPDTYEAWTDTFGRANIAEFDQHHITYFTRDRFDFFFPSYGSSYPSILGAIGMLTEQGGIGAGRAVITEDDYVLSLRQRVFDHYTTTLATIRAAARNRTALHRYSLAAWDPASAKTNTAAYLIADDGNPYLKDLIDILHRNRVDFFRTSAGLSETMYNYRTGEIEVASLAAGTLVIPTNQARHLFVETLLTPHMAIEDSVMYDMSTWSAPLAYNLQAYSTEKPLRVDMEVATAMSAPNLPAIPDLEKVPYALLIDINQRHSMKALAMLWEKGYRVRAAHQAFSTVAGRTFSAGSLIVLLGRQESQIDLEKLRGDIFEIAYDTEVDISVQNTGRMATGMDLGSTRNRPLKQPRVGMIVEPPFSTYTSGQVYFLFDQETQLPVERLRASTLDFTAIPQFGQRYGNPRLEGFDVIILPGGSMNNLKKLFGETQLTRLKAWVQAGGTLVALEGAAQFLTTESGFVEQAIDKGPEVDKLAASALDYRDREEFFGERRIPGSALAATIDNSHPLGFGLPEEVYSLKFGSVSLVPSQELQSVGRYHQDSTQLLVAGYAPDASLSALAGNTWAGVRTMGRGKVVYLLDNPHYRMFWRGPSRLMQNAVMMVPGF